jgi:hypothetical protein
MSLVEISDETYRRLFAFAESFDDSPEVVINRLLDQMDPTPGRGQNRSRRSGPVAPGSILPESDYWVPILKIVAEKGGAARATEVIEVLGRELSDRLKPADNQRLNTGETRWKNRARFARLRMKEQGLLSSTAGRGVWEITEAGRQFLTNREQAGVSSARRGTA